MQNLLMPGKIIDSDPKPLEMEKGTLRKLLILPQGKVRNNESMEELVLNRQVIASLYSWFRNLKYSKKEFLNKRFYSQAAFACFCLNYQEKVAGRTPKYSLEI